MDGKSQGYCKRKESEKRKSEREWGEKQKYILLPNDIYWRFYPYETGNLE